MRNLFLLPLVLFSLGINATPVDSLLRAAEQAYAGGDHQAALSGYTEALSHGRSAALLFNIGNCHYKLGDVALAILNYERALKLAPGDEDIRANLDLARSRTKDRVSELPTSQVMQRWYRFAGGRDSDHWARRTMFLTVLLFAALAALLFIRRQTWRNIVGVGAGVLAGLMVIALLMAYVRHRSINSHDEAIIMAPRVEVKSEPTDRGTVLFVIHRGTKVKVLQVQQGRLEVRLANGSQGWLEEDQLERI
ncbi:MAG: tetratricopeptide repeat protein [Flavobacteriales bacterium]